VRKHQEICFHGSCLGKAGVNEMLFVLRTVDAASPATIRFWCEERVRLGKNKVDDEQIKEALACAATMETEREEMA
jgi:hypothetical protein